MDNSRKHRSDTRQAGFPLITGVSGSEAIWQTEEETSSPGGTAGSELCQVPTDCVVVSIKCTGLTWPLPQLSPQSLGCVFLPSRAGRLRSDQSLPLPSSVAHKDTCCFALLQEGAKARLGSIEGGGQGLRIEPCVYTPSSESGGPATGASVAFKPSTHSQSPGRAPLRRASTALCTTLHISKHSLSVCLCPLRAV